MSGVRVRATPQGFPVHLSISKEALRYGAAHVADEVIRQCREAALEGAVAIREHCEQAGVSQQTLAELSVPTAAELATAREAAEARRAFAPTLEKWGFTR
ncbi:hypothetical protein [Hoyosella altamirensis]|nr:hypothetical protein [Hoyosella altamirensis]